MRVRNSHIGHKLRSRNKKDTRTVRVRNSKKNGSSSLVVVGVVIAEIAAANGEPEVAANGEPEAADGEAEAATKEEVATNSRKEVITTSQPESATMAPKVKEATKRVQTSKRGPLKKLRK